MNFWPRHGFPSGVTGRPTSGRRGFAFDDRGSTIPLILGFFVLALLIVVGGVAASDAFTSQRQVQSACDGATLAAAQAVDFGAVRSLHSTPDELPLQAVQDAAAQYAARNGGDHSEGALDVKATLSADGTHVEAVCTETRALTFGSLFGYGHGVTHTVQSSAITAVAGR